ncbi:hypothetical protein [Sorangium sp. So ce1078]|uniref:hypothetical protein n=1 Tax=Sorangium sp. So ce1078 TaxID=3133329 RepID=UPI003F644237
MTVEQIVAAIRALPVTDRLGVIELVPHEAAGDVPAADHPSRREGVTLTERHGLLLVDADVTSAPPGNPSRPLPPTLGIPPSRGFTTAGPP